MKVKTQQSSEKENGAARAAADFSNRNSQSSFAVMPKLEVGQVGDEYEQEADRTADQVMQTPENGAVQMATLPEEKIQKKSISGDSSSWIQQKERKDEEEPVQMKSVNPSQREIPEASWLENQINNSKGSGNPLPDESRSFMESRFGADFGNVKIHTGSNAVQMSRELNAQAFTHGSDVFFNRGKFNPENSLGNHLLAHELTHVVQQTNTPKVQRLPEVPPTAENTPATAQPSPSTVQNTVTPANEAEVRESVVTATDFLTRSAEFYDLATVDQATLDRVLSSWSSMATIYPDLIQTRLNNDAGLLQSFKNALNNAVRVLFTRAAALIPNTTVIQLYLSNLHLLPDWARPDVASFNLTDETQRRTFITNLTNAFNITTLFQNYPITNSVSLESLLSYLMTLITDSQNLIADQLNNDASLRSLLQDAYRTAIEQILTRAATVLNQSVMEIFLQYRYGANVLIHEWADRNVPGTTGAVPMGTTGSGTITMSYNGFQIIIEPDGTQTAAGAETTFHINYSTQIARSWDRHGIITSFTPPIVPVITIRTNYGPGASASTASGYGHGTTTEDTRLGNTSLGYHERSHSRDFLGYIVNNSAPTFTGAIGDTRRVFSNAESQYVQALQAYSPDNTRASELSTDCVGTTIVQYHTNQGTTTQVTCP